MDDECNRLLQRRNISPLHVPKVALFNLEGTGDSMGSRRAGERNQEMKAMCRIDALAIKVK